MIKVRHTIDSGIVKDVLAELAKTDMQNRYLGGGLSAQFYLPSTFYRATADVDLESSELTTPENFKSFIENISDHLKQRGYDTTFKKERGTWDQYFTRDDSQLILQMPRRSEKKFEQVKPKLEREVANSENIPYAEGKIRIINPNDLIGRKIGRSDMFRREYSLKVPFKLRAVDYLDKVNHLINTTDFSLVHPKDSPKIIANIRMMADLVDIHALKENVSDKLDPKYILDSLEEFPTQDKKSLMDFYSNIF